LAQNLPANDWDLIDHITTEVLRTTDDVRARHCRKSQHLHETQHPPHPPDNKKVVVNLSEVPLEEAACLAVALAQVPFKDILCGVEKTIGTLPEEIVEEIQQETSMILKGSCKPKDNLTGAERRALQALKTNEALTVLPTDKGNVAMILDTSDYNWKIIALLEDKAYNKLKKDPTDSVECTSVLLLKSSHFLRRFANSYDHKVPGPLDCCRRSTNLMFH
jgi:hypothetical protein